nr:MAG TPA: hypothetical protein [Bacteriophage sp.]
MSKNTIVLNNRDEFIKFTEDRVLREFAKVFISNKKYHLENMMEAIRFYVSFKTVNTPKESSFPIVFKIDEYNSMLVVNDVDKYPLHRGNKFINGEFEEFMNTICDNLEYDSEKGLIKTVDALADIFVVETFFCYERMNKPEPKISGSSPEVMEIVGTTPKGEKVVPNDPFKVVVKDKTITVKVSKGYIVNVESM